MMKKYKIVLGNKSEKDKKIPIISADNEREAVIKFLQSSDEEVTEEKISQYMSCVHEFVPKSGNKPDIKPLTEPDVKRLEKICENVVDIEEGLMYGTIPFTYDNLMSAIKPGDPMEILDSLLANIYFIVMSGKEPPIQKLEETLKNFKGYKNAFQVKEMSEPIKDLEDYIRARKLGESYIE